MIREHRGQGWAVDMLDMARPQGAFQSQIYTTKELKNKTYMAFPQFVATLCPQFKQNLPVSSHLSKTCCFFRTR